MSENPNTNQPQEEQPVSNSPAEAQTTDTHMIPKHRFDEVNNKYKELAQQLAQMKEAQQQQKAQELEEQNRFKELYEETQKQLEQMKSVQQQAELYKTSLQTTNEARIQSIPEERRSLVPEFDDPVKLSAWLDKALPALVDVGKPPAPKLDGGSGSAGGSSDGTQKPLSATQQQLAEYLQQSGIQLNTDRLRQFNRTPSTQTDLDKKD